MPRNVNRETRARLISAFKREKLRSVKLNLSKKLAEMQGKKTSVGSRKVENMMRNALYAAIDKHLSLKFKESFKGEREAVLFQRMILKESIRDTVKRWGYEDSENDFFRSFPGLHKQTSKMRKQTKEVLDSVVANNRKKYLSRSQKEIEHVVDYLNTYAWRHLLFKGEVVKPDVLNHSVELFFSMF